MAAIPRVHVGKVWRLMLGDLGLSRELVFRRAGLSPSVIDGEGTRIPLDDFYRLCAVLTEEVNDPLLALKLGQLASVEYFDPAVFAAICSPDMNTAAQRLGEFKRRVSAFFLDVGVDAETTTLTYGCTHRPDVPATVGVAELVFLVGFARRATRSELKPLRVLVDEACAQEPAYAEYFGCPVEQGPCQVILSAADARRPFLTHDEAMWQSFEPALRRRIEDAEARTSIRVRVEQALFELLPSGRSRMQDAAKELAMSTRTLQRRLAEEDTTWLEVLNSTRERLARHYLTATDMGPAEVSFLLGFEDPNSLFRAFHRWTGTSPEAWRASHRDAAGAQA